MTCYDELVARGLIAQVTDEAEIRELINNGKAVFYIGFDPTADSLHVGHFMSSCRPLPTASLRFCRTAASPTSPAPTTSISRSSATEC